MKRLLLLLFVLAAVGCSSMAPLDVPRDPLEIDASMEHIEVFAETAPQ